MGSSGMKRKGRTHLPKVGTKNDQAWVRREGVKHMEHPFSDDPSTHKGAWAHIGAVVVVALLLFGMLGWLIVTA
jgi:hypothetical protein